VNQIRRPSGIPFDPIRFDDALEASDWAYIPPTSNRKASICFRPWLYKERNQADPFFTKFSYFKRIATCLKFGAASLAMVKLSSIRLRICVYQQWSNMS
jgi:transposase